MKSIFNTLLFSMAIIASSSQLFAAGTTALAPNGNILSPSVTTAHTQIPPASTFNGAKTVDNLISSNNVPADTGLIFYGSETFNPGGGVNQQLLAMTGFNSSIGEIWIYSLTNDALRVPEFVTIKSSTSSTTSLSDLSYETSLVTNLQIGQTYFTHQPIVDVGQDPFYAPSPTIGVRYAVIPVNAPAGTQSLYFDFGAGGSFGGNGARIQEIQAFAAVPEPSSIAIVCGALGTMLFSQRFRRKNT
jgi:hypothetical protein